MIGRIRRLEICASEDHKMVTSTRVCASIQLMAVILALTFAVDLTAQPRPLRFDVLTVDAGSSYTETNGEITKRARRFADEAKRRPTDLKYLVHYRARLREANRFWNRADQWAAATKWAVAYTGRNLDDKNILVVDGGIRENEALEMWFVPRGAAVPISTPKFDRSDSIDCPWVVAQGDGLYFDRSRPIVFEASVEGAESYDWTVSDGQIIGKNGWSRLEVDVTGAKSDRITAFLDVKGLHPMCKSTAMAVQEFGQSPRLFDSFGALPNGDIRARLDAFAAALSGDPALRGYAYIYADRTAGRKTSEARKRLISNQFYFRGFDMKRISLLDAGYRETVSTDLWIAPTGVEPPTPMPTVDGIFVERPTVRLPVTRRMK